MSLKSLPKNSNTNSYPYSPPIDLDDNDPNLNNSKSSYQAGQNQPTPLLIQKQPINQVNTHPQKKTPFEIFGNQADHQLFKQQQKKQQQKEQQEKEIQQQQIATSYNSQQSQHYSQQSSQKSIKNNVSAANQMCCGSGYGGARSATDLTELDNNSGQNNLTNYVAERENFLKQQQQFVHQKQIMMERTNYIEPPSKQTQQQQQKREQVNKDIQQTLEQDSLINQKMQVLYYTNPLNVIPESWGEQDSKTSIMQESQSLQMISKSDRRMKEQQQQNSVILEEGGTQASEQRGHNSQQYIMSPMSARRSPYQIINESPLEMRGDAEDSKEQIKQKQQHSNAKSAQSSSKQSSQQVSQMSSSSKAQKKEGVEQVKKRLKQLFLNYCDFSIDNGTIFISYTNFMKIIKDSRIIDGNKITQNNISIVLSKECNVTNNSIKNITFEQFLNCLLRLSELKYAEVSKKNPKKALQQLLKTTLLPLLERIEDAVEKQSDDFQHSLFSVSEMTLKLIVFNEDTQVIFADIQPLLKQLYQMYFDQEISQQKGKVQDLQAASLKSVMSFVREFELSPYLVHQKACFLIWYSVAYSVNTQELSNNPKQKYLFSSNQNMGKCFTLGHFAVFIYRLSVIYFNHSQEQAQNFNLVKKLLYFFRKLENGDGFKKFMRKLNRTYNDSLTFLPSKDLLVQILKAEGMEDIGEYQLVSKEAMISRIIDTHLYQHLHIQQQQQLQQYQQNNSNNMNQGGDEGDENIEGEEGDINQQFLFNVDDDLKRLFEIYCSYGEPMNTKYLKSSKLLKLLKECGLVKSISKLQIMGGQNQRILQVSTQEIDLVFKQICFKGANPGVGFDPTQSQMNATDGISLDHSHMASQFQSQLGSRLGLRLGQSTVLNPPSALGKTMSFEQHSHLLDKNSNQGRLDFSQFKKVLEVLSTKVFPDSMNTFTTSSSFASLLKHFILPLQDQANEKRCVHSKKIQQMLSQLDNQDMIELLTLFHKAIIDIYKQYADNKGLLNFTKFINLCSDYDIFPGMVSKAALYRIFHSLSFINEILGGNGKNNNTTSQQMMSSSKMMGSTMLRGGGDKQGLSQQVELIDEHLFIEALALCALFNGSKEEELCSLSKGQFTQEDPYQETSSESSIEKMLSFIERMANSDGIHKKLKRGTDLSSSIKCSLLNKRDILEPFRVKYAWYFKNKYEMIEQSMKKKNFQDIMEMSSVWTNSSQIMGEGDERRQGSQIDDEEEEYQ